MKMPIVVIGCLAAGALALLAACQPADTVSETASCTECHSRDTTVGGAVLTAQTQYDNSGHLNGPRVLNPTPGDIYEFEGSNSYGGGAGASCNKCHTHQGFLDFITAGMPSSYTGKTYFVPTPPECFTCHKPHIAGDFTPRKTSSETLADGTTVYDGGAGNLCATCHKSRRTASSFLTGFPKTWGSSDGPHHGPQADFLMGVNQHDYGKPYAGQSVHLDPRDPNSCVDCHMYTPTDRLRNLQLGGHGMYLSAEVSAALTDVVGVCASCHTGFGTSLTGDFESVAAINTRLDDIRANRDLLIGYFGNGTTNFSGNGTGPIESLTGNDVASGEWNKDWVFASATLSQTQSYAFWNFKLFIEDRSQGIHNPYFAHQILYDAVEALGMTPVGTPPNRP